MDMDWTALAELDGAELGGRRPRRIGAGGMASVIDEARASVAASADEWGSRRRELGQVDEYEVVQPYVGLSKADELDDLTDRFWEVADAEDWGDKLEAYLVEAVRTEAGS